MRIDEWWWAVAVGIAACLGAAGFGTVLAVMVGMVRNGFQV